METTVFNLELFLWCFHKSFLDLQSFSLQSPVKLKDLSGAFCSKGG